MRCKNTTITRRMLRNAAVVLVTGSVSTATPALAQFQGILEEITVTAQKREQSLEEVPASVSTIAGDNVNDYLGSAENIRALAGRVPSLQVESSNGRTQPRFYIRGQGNIDFDVNAAQPVAMVFDEVGLENNVLRSIPLFDIERIEVLKGPQGSLFGRNTNAGIVKIDSVRPSFDFNGYLAGAAGSRDTYAVQGAVGGPISETVAVRVAAKFQDRGEWIDNIGANTPGDDFGGFEEAAGRIQLLWQPHDGFRGLFKFHNFRQTGSQPQVFYANAIELGSEGLRPGFDEEIANHDADAGMDLKHYGASANLQWDNGDWTITSITSYDTLENFQFTDVDGGFVSFDPADIGALGRQVFFGVATGDGLDDHRQLTQELRFAYQGDSLFYQFGLYYLDEDIDVINRDTVTDIFDIANQQTDSIAVFGQVDIPFGDNVNLILGGRFTSDEKELSNIPGPGSGSPADTISVDDDYFNWDAALNVQVNDDLSIYGRVANASRGPVTLGRFGFTSSAETETSNAAEIGFKSTLAGGRARWNAALYYFQNDDQQLTATGGVANINQLLNADKVIGNGFETDVEFLLSDRVRVLANVGYNDTEIDDPNLGDEVCGSSPTCTFLDPIIGMRLGNFGPVTDVSIDGNPLPRSPEWTANIILQFTQPLASGAQFYANTDWNYRSESNLFLHESVEFVAEERWIGGIRIGYRTASENLDLAFVGRNVTDEIVVDGGINFLNLTAFVNEPAYWGLEARWDFD